MLLWFLLASGLAQIAFYALAEYGEGRRVKRGAVGATLIVLHGAVFPDYFIPRDMPEGGCGMPVFGVYMAFWIFGIGSAVLIHLLTGILRHLRRPG